MQLHPQVRICILATSYLIPSQIFSHTDFDGPNFSDFWDLETKKHNWGASIAMFDDQMVTKYPNQMLC